MDDPDVRFPVGAEIASVVDLDWGQPGGEHVWAVVGEALPGLLLPVSGGPRDSHGVGDGFGNPAATTGIDTDPGDVPLNRGQRIAVLDARAPGKRS
jgi:hypothetical protein